AGRHHRQGHADPGGQRRRGVLDLWCHPCRVPLRRNRPEAPFLQEVWDPPVSDPTAPAPAPRLKERYVAEIRTRLKDELGVANIMEVPRFEKIVVNMGVGRATQQASLLEGAVKDLTVITGQKPMVTRARKSIANFKLREGNAIGAKVTLRGARMWEFFDRLVSIAIPRIRDFRGLPQNSFDGHG